VIAVVIVAEVALERLVAIVLSRKPSLLFPIQPIIYSHLPH